MPAAPAEPSLDAYLPTLERARAAGVSLRARLWYKPAGVELLEREPLEQRRLAAITVDARVLARATWEKDVEMSEALLATYPTGVPEEPAGFLPASHRRLVSVYDAAASLCSNCPARPGRELCPRCGGHGRILVQQGNRDVWSPCPVCSAQGFIQCAVCDGTARSRRARVRFVEDRLSALQYTYVPSLTSPLEGALDEALAFPGDEDPPPGCLRFDPRDRASGGPYRSGPAVEPTFHGHHFGDALSRAGTAVGGLGAEGQILRQDVRVYARPILLLRYAIWGIKRDAVLTMRASGEPFGFVAP